MVVAPGIITPSKVIAETQKAIQPRQPLYEAAFSYDGGYARADILVPVADNCPYRKCYPARTPVKSATSKKMKSES